MVLIVAATNVRLTDATAGVKGRAAPRTGLRRERSRWSGKRNAPVRRTEALVSYRELDDASRLADTATGASRDTRTGRNTRHGPVALLRRSILSRPDRV